MRELDLEPGPEIGSLLDALREAMAAGEIATREEALLLASTRLRKRADRRSDVSTL
jgi:hypothetical protein